MFASLPMYERPANAAAHDAFWTLIRDGLRDHGINAPENLDRTTDYMAGWARADLILGQICNLPYRAKYQGKVTAIGAADYGLDGCAAGEYLSVIVVPKNAAVRSYGEYAGARFAANAMGSHSGYGAPQAWAASHGFCLSSPMLTGSHDRSLALIANGQADIAALDAQTWRMQLHDTPDVENVRIIATT